MTSPEDVDKYFEVERCQLIRLANRLLQLPDVQTAEEVVQDTHFIVRNAAHTIRHSLAGFVFRALSRKCNKLRERRKEERERQKRYAEWKLYAERKREAKSSEEVGLEIDPDFRKKFLRSREFDIHLLHMEGYTYKEIAKEVKMKENSVGQAYSRLRVKFVSCFTAWCFANKWYRDLNHKYQYTDTQAKQVAGSINRHCKDVIDCMFEVFQEKHLIDAPKNTLMILRHFLPKAGARPNKVERFLVTLLEENKQFRGLNVRIGDTLLDADSKKHMPRYKNELLARLREMDDRKEVAVMPREQVKAAEFKNLCDHKEIVMIGHEIPTCVVRELCRIYKEDDISFDLRRSLNFQLQRLHPEDQYVIDTLIQGLEDEWDLPNACYLVSYLLSDGCRKYHPEIYTRSLVQILESLLANDRFSESAFLKRSVQTLDNWARD